MRDSGVRVAEPAWHAALPWPLATIDFEASSLDNDGYPIEVGLALWLAPEAPVLGWSTLILPAGDWTRRGHWSPASAKVHGISRSDLSAHGQSPACVAATLNTVLGTGIAWCDGGLYDAEWARTLFIAAGVDPLFILGDWNGLADLLGPTAREQALAWLKRGSPRHRARADAEQLLLALAHVVGANPGPAQDGDQHIPAFLASFGPDT